MTDPKQKIAFIKARWHAEIVDQAEAGFRAAWGGGPVETFAVPGAFEMPLLARQLAEQGEFAAVVAAAFVVDGGIYRHEFVAAAVVDGLMRAQMDSGVPVFSVSLTPQAFQDTPAHVAFFRDHFAIKGAEAAGAVAMVLDDAARSRAA